MSKKFKILEHSIETRVKYSINRTYELPLSRNFFNKLINDIFSLNISSEKEKESLIYKDFQIELPKVSNLLVKELKITSGSLQILLFGKTVSGETILNKIVHQFKKMKSISEDENLVKEKNYSSYVKIKAENGDVKVEDFLNDKLISFFRDYGNKFINLFKDEGYEILMHPFLIRGVIHIFPSKCDKNDLKLVSDSVNFSIMSESFGEYNEGILSFYSDLPYEDHIDLISKLFEIL